MIKVDFFNKTYNSEKKHAYFIWTNSTAQYNLMLENCLIQMRLKLSIRLVKCWYTLSNISTGIPNAPIEAGSSL